MTREERELSITYLEGMKEEYIEGEGFERHPLPEYYAIENAIKALEQESILDKIEKEINSPNRGTCDYYIVDRIEEIIDKYKLDSEITK